MGVVAKREKGACYGLVVREPSGEFFCVSARVQRFVSDSASVATPSSVVSDLHYDASFVESPEVLCLCLAQAGSHVYVGDLVNPPVEPSALFARGLGGILEIRRCSCGSID